MGRRRYLRAARRSDRSYAVHVQFSPGEPTGDEPGAAIESMIGDLGIDAGAIEAEEHRAAQRWSSIEAGRRKGGVAGAAMAGAMLAVGEIYEGPQRDEIVAVAEHPGEPGDIDRDGIDVSVDGLDVWAPPPGAET
jgi:hypothetical protein